MTPTRVVLELKLFICRLVNQHLFGERKLLTGHLTEEQEEDMLKIFALAETLNNMS